MKKTLCLVLTLLSMLAAQDSKIDQVAAEAALELRMAQLSQALDVEGAGGAAYGEVLAEDYTRWTVGKGKINAKTPWVKGIADWFDSGWRVVESTNQILEVTLTKEHAHVRRIVTEAYAGPDGEDESYRTGVVEQWVRKEGQWYLRRASVSPTKIK